MHDLLNRTVVCEQSLTGSLRHSCKVCVVAHMAYGAMSGCSKGHIGGVERQTSLMAKWLAARGWQVSMITWDEGGPREELIDGVRVIKLCRAVAGLPGLRFLHPRWTSLVGAMRRADADVYYQNCAEYVTGQVALWCRQNARRFVYSVASNPDVEADLPQMRQPHERVLYRYGLRHADGIIVQTEFQRSRLQAGFGLDSTVIPMPCPGPGELEYRSPQPPANGSARVLWVGRICEQKRPDRLLELARLMPNVNFDLVGPAGPGGYGQKIVRLAGEVENIHVHGGIERERIGEFYRKAACLLCTSDVEGFPNTFLEAWSHGLPVISTFDPDGVIAGRQLGVHAQPGPELVTRLRLLLNSAATWQAASDNARRYYLETHAVERVMPRFAQAFLDVLARPKMHAGGRS